MALSDTKIKKAKPSEKQIKLFDGGGLFLLVTPQGSKLWRLKYRHGGKEKLLALGTYPTVSLADARRKRDEARRQLDGDLDPGEARKVQKQVENRETETFELIAREWHAEFIKTWSDSHAATISRRMEVDLFPWIGSRTISEIKAPELLAVSRRVEKQGAKVLPMQRMA